MSGKGDAMSIEVTFRNLSSSSPMSYRVQDGMSLGDFLSEEVAISNINKVSVLVDGNQIRSTDIDNFVLRHGMSITLRPKMNRFRHCPPRGGVGLRRARPSKPYAPPEDRLFFRRRSSSFSQLSSKPNSFF